MANTLGLVADTLNSLLAMTFAFLQDASTLPAGIGPVWAMLTGIAGLIVLNALFVGAETAVELLRPHHVRMMKEEKPQTAAKLQHLLDDQLRFVAACVLGSMIARLGIVLLALLLAPQVLSWLIAYFGFTKTDANLVLTALALMVPLGAVHLVFGELVPKSYATLHPPRVAAILYPFVRASAVIFSPAAMAVTAIAEVLTKRFGGHASFAAPDATEEEILTLVETAEETGEIEQGERELLKSVFDFTDTVVREIMTPRVDMEALPVDSDPTEAVRLIQETGHSRIPLYDGTDDQIVGVIHAKDLLLAMLNGKAPNLRSLMRKALFVPENKSLYELIREMNQNRTQLAVVQDELGGTAGIVTTEDIVEELVGEIVDEYDVEEPDIVALEDGWLIDGKTHVSEVNETIGSKFESEEFDTIGGYVFGLFGKEPRPNDTIEADGFRFTVVQTDGRRIARLHVAKLPEQLQLEPLELER